MIRTTKLALAILFSVQASVAADLGFADLPCPVGGGGPRIVYLSAAIPGACTDANQLQNIIFQLGQTGMLVVDKPCTLNAGIRLPSRFTLKGLGLGSVSQVVFTHDGIGVSVCQEQPRGYVTIDGLDFYGPYASRISATHSTGIALANLNIVSIRNVRISDFQTGLSGHRSYSVLINGANISNNRGNNVVVGYDSNGWRIRDSVVSQAGDWGINILGPGDAEPIVTSGLIINASNDLLIDGVRMESNSLGAVRTDSYGTRITNSRFEGNGKGNLPLPNRGLLVDTHADQTRILTNLFSGDCIRIVGAGTQRAFNIPAQLNTDQCAGLGFIP